VRGAASGDSGRSFSGPCVEIPVTLTTARYLDVVAVFDFFSDYSTATMKLHGGPINRMTVSLNGRLKIKIRPYTVAPPHSSTPTPFVCLPSQPSLE